MIASLLRRTGVAAVAMAAALLPSMAAAQATVVIVNGDPPGQGFNDPTPAAPVGGNPGVTLGEQRLNAFQFAADRWGETLTSTLEIRVLAFFEPLSCTATSAALGAAAPYLSLRDFAPEPGFPGLTPGTFYPIALAEKRTGFPIMDTFFPAEPFQAFAFFNSELGQPGCLEGSGWYYGLDTNGPASHINLVTVLLHEFGHGMGFTVGTTNASTGRRSGSTAAAPDSGFPSVWEGRMRDLTLDKTWLQMTAAERAFSARNNSNLVWQGVDVVADAPEVLAPGLELVVQGPGAVAGRYQAEAAAFGAPITGAFHDVLMPAYDAGGVSREDGCEPFRSDVRGRIALVNRGNCTFLVKAQNAQAAGASGLLIANNAPGLFSVGGADPTIVIPVAGVSQATGDLLRALPQLSNPGRGGLPVRLQLSQVFLSGATGIYPRLYAPAAFAQGSSVSHWDTTLTPNQLMEPFINVDLTHQLVKPYDLTFSLLKDIGW
jgi:hypothetical protein